CLLHWSSDHRRLHSFPTRRSSDLFEAKPKIACPECDIPVIYGDTPKSNVLENKDMEDVAISQERQNLAVPQPQLEQANHALVAQRGAQEYAPHVIRKHQSFQLKIVLQLNPYCVHGLHSTD